MSSQIPQWLSKPEQGLKRPASLPDELEQPPKRLAGPTTNYAHIYDYRKYGWTATSQAQVLPAPTGSAVIPNYTTNYVGPRDQDIVPSIEIQQISFPILPMPVYPISLVSQTLINQHYYGNPTPNQISEPFGGYQPPYANLYDDGNCPNIRTPLFPMQPPADLIMDIFNGPLAVTDAMLNEFNLAIDKIVEDIKIANELYAHKLGNDDVTSALRWKIRERMFQVMWNKPVLSRYNIFNCYRSTYHIDSDVELFVKECGVDFSNSYIPQSQTQPSEIFDGPDSASPLALTIIDSAIDQIFKETVSHIKSEMQVDDNKLIVVKPFVRNRIHNILVGYPVPNYGKLMDAYKASYKIKGHDQELRDLIFFTSKSHPINDPRTSAEKNYVFTGPQTASDGTLIFLANTALSLVNEIPAKVSKIEMMGLRWSVLERLYKLMKGSTMSSASHVRLTYKQVFRPSCEYKLVGYVRSTKFKRTWAAMDLHALDKGVTRLRRSIENSDSVKIEKLAKVLFTELSKIQSATVKFHLFTLKCLVRYRIYTLFEGKPFPANLYEEYRKNYDIQSDRILLSDVLRGRTNWIFPKGSDLKSTVSIPVRQLMLDSSQNIAPARLVEIQQDMRTQTSEVNACTSTVNVSQSSLTITTSVVSTETSTRTTNVDSTEEKDHNFNASLTSIENTKRDCQEIKQDSNETPKSNDIAYIHNRENEQNSIGSSVSNGNLNIKSEKVEQNSETSVISNENINIKSEGNEHSFSGAVISDEKMNIKCEEIERMIIKAEKNWLSFNGSVVSNENMNIKCEEIEPMIIKSEKNGQSFNGSVVSNENMNIKCEEIEPMIIKSEKNGQSFNGSVVSNENMNIKCEEIEPMIIKSEKNEQSFNGSVVSNENMNIKCEKIEPMIIKSEKNGQSFNGSVISTEKLNIKCETSEQMNIKCEENKKENSSVSVISNERLNIKCEENEQNCSGPLIPNDIIYIDCEENEQNCSGSVTQNDIIHIDFEENEQNSCFTEPVKSNENINTDSEDNEPIFNGAGSICKAHSCINEALYEIVDQMKLDNKIQDYQKSQILILIKERILKIFKRKQALCSEGLVREYRRFYNEKSDHATVQRMITNSIFSGPQYTSTFILEKIELLANRITIGTNLDFSQTPSSHEKVVSLVKQRLYDMCMGIRVPRVKKLYKRYRKTYNTVDDIKEMFNLTYKNQGNAAPTIVKPNEGQENSKSKIAQERQIFNGRDTANSYTLQPILKATLDIVDSMNEACCDLSDLDLTYLRFIVQERIYELAMGVSIQSVAHIMSLYRQQYNVESDSQLIHDISTRTHSKKFADSYQNLYELTFESLKSAETYEKVYALEKIILKEIRKKHNQKFQFYDVFIKWIVRYRIYKIIKTNADIIKCNLYTVYRQLFNNENDHIIISNIVYFVKCIASEKCCLDPQSDSIRKYANKLFHERANVAIIKSVQDEIRNKVSDLMRKELDTLIKSCNLEEATSRESGIPTDGGTFEKIVHRLVHQRLRDIESGLTYIIAKDRQVYSSLGLLPLYRPPVKHATRQIMLTGYPKLPRLEKVQKYLESRCNARAFHVYGNMKNVMYVDIESDKSPEESLLNSIVIDGYQLSAKLVPRSFTEYTPENEKISIEKQCIMDTEYNNGNNEKITNDRCIENNIELPTDLQDFDKSLKELDNHSKLSSTNENHTENNVEFTSDLEDLNETASELEDRSKYLNSNSTNGRNADMELTTYRLATDLQDLDKTANKLEHQVELSNSSENCTLNNLELTRDLRNFNKMINKVDRELNYLFISLNRSEILEAQ